MPLNVHDLEPFRFSVYRQDIPKQVSKRTAGFLGMSSDSLRMARPHGLEAAIAVPPEPWSRRVGTIQVLAVGPFRNAYRAIWRFARFFVPAFEEFEVLPAIVPIPERFLKQATLQADLHARFYFEQGVIMYRRPFEELRN